MTKLAGSATSTPGIPGGSRWPWLSDRHHPALLAALLLLTMAALFGALRREHLKTRREALANLAQTCAQNQAFTLRGHEDYLQLLAEERAKGTLGPKEFQTRAAAYVADHPELLNITWVDAALVIREVAPEAGNRQILGLSLTLPEPKRVAALAQAQKAPAYTRPFEAIQGRASFEVWVPVFRTGQFLGLFAGVYSCPRLAQGMLTADLAQRHHLALRDASGSLLGALPLTGGLDPALAQDLPLTPPGHGVTLRLQCYTAHHGQAGPLILGALCGALVVWLVFSLTTRRRFEAQERLLQTQLHQAQKMESLGRLAGGVAHDMNNVLAAILGLASANLERQPPASEAHLAFTTIIKAAERGGQMVKSLLSFARQSPAQPRELDLNDLLREEVNLLERTLLAPVELRLELAAGLPPMHGDPSALSHAIMNLCVNAVDAMPAGGRLTLRTRQAGADWLELQVEDTGTGMPQAVLDQALDPFFTTKGVGKGTGLGLALVYSTVKAHQGLLELASEPGQGTRVTLRFPACAAGASVPEPAAPPSGPAAASLQVLVVDDDELIQTTLQALLQVLGHHPTQACSGEEALALLAAGAQPQVVILDMNMPGLGGPGTLPRLRALRPELPVLLSTGRVDQTALDLAGAHPGVTLLPKPFAIHELQRQLDGLAHVPPGQTGLS